MKKTTKSLLLSALVLLCTGLLLSVGSAIYVKIKGIDPYGMKAIDESRENKTVSIEEVLTLSPESNFNKKLSEKEFLKIDINSFAGDVIIRSAETTCLELKDAAVSNVTYEIVGETLTFSEKDPVGIMGVYIDKGGFSFKGLRQIFGPGNSANTKKCMIVNLAEGSEIDSIKINSKVGNVTVDGVFVNSLEISSASGEITLQNLPNTAAKINCKGSDSDIKMDQSFYSSCNLTTKFGVIQAHVLDLNNLSTVAETWFGDILIETDVPTKEYKLNFSTSNGTVIHNGKDVGEELENHAVNSTRITASSLFGDLGIRFTGGEEVDSAPVDSEPVTTPDQSASPDQVQQPDPQAPAA